VSAIATITLNPALDIATSTPRIMPTHKLRCAAPLRHAGGGGVNVARVVHGLGGTVTALFPAGGIAGEIICRLLKTAGVPFVATRIEGETRESFAVTEKDSGAQYRFVLPGPELSPQEQWRLLESVLGLAPSPGHLVLSGSLPQGVSAQFLRRLRKIADDLGAEILLDTSSEGLKLAAGLDALLAKPSRRELEGFAGQSLAGDAQLAEAARALIREGVARSVLVSLGAEGALLVTPATAQRFAAIPVPVLSSIGAGDSMVGALTLALSRGRPVEEAVRRGIVAGAAALMRPGTHLAHAADVGRLFAEMSATVP